MLIEKDHAIFVNTYCLEIYLPADYASKAYRSNAYFSVLGTKVRFFGVGNMRFYKTEKEKENPLSVKCHPLGFPMMIMSEPSEIDTRDVQFIRGGEIRKCIVLTYYKNDMLMTNTACIKNNDNVMIVLSRLEGGKLDHVSPAVAEGIFADCQTMNKVALRIPTEVEEVFIAERYRDPDKPSQKARFSDEPIYGDDYVSYNMRQEAMKTTTYQAITHEDINTSLISAVNRSNKGIVDEVTIQEALVRGLSVEKYIQERDARIAKEEAEKAKRKETEG